MEAALGLPEPHTRSRIGVPHFSLDVDELQHHASTLVGSLLADEALLSKLNAEYILVLEHECPDFTQFMEEATGGNTSLRRLLTMLLHAASPAFDFRRSVEFADFGTSTLTFVTACKGSGINGRS